MKQKSVIELKAKVAATQNQNSWLNVIYLKYAYICCY